MLKKIVPAPLYTFYIGEGDTLTYDKCGKWMYRPYDLTFARKICSKAVEENIVEQAKHSNDGGVCCFYLNIDDTAGHKRVIEFFLQNQLIPKTKAGKYRNISFKLDSQTRAGQYGKDFVPKLTLADILDLETGQFKI